MTKKTSKDSFEFKIKRLEEIASLLENEETGIEEAIKLFEEGVSLSKECIETLKNAELKITELRNQIDEVSSKE
ncbi:MAG: exodeoxyribonuclease VII small subunit [Ignavibacteriaceae bacterium]